MRYVTVVIVAIVLIAAAICLLTFDSNSKRQLDGNARAVDTEPQETPLQTAVIDGDFKRAVALISDGVDIDAKTNVAGRTALQFAAMNCSAELVELLLSNGADAGNLDHDDSTALHFAAGSPDSYFDKGDCESCVELLLSAGGEVNAKDSYGQSPLHISATYSSSEVFELMIRSGADTSSRTNTGESIAHYIARSPGSSEVAAAKVKLLKEAGGQFSLQDDSGRTPRELAASLDRLDIAKLLDPDIK